MIRKFICLVERAVKFMQPICRRRQLRRCIRAFGKKSPQFLLPVDLEVEREHERIWGRLGLPVKPYWVRMLSRVSGFADPRYCPEDLYHSFIERVLNDMSRRDFEAEDKNSFGIYVEKKYIPRVYLRYIRGMFMDEGYSFLSESEAEQVLKGNHGRLIGKVAVGSLGGHSVSAYDYVDGRYQDSTGRPLTVALIKSIGSYVLQESVEQCEFTAQFNPASVNTFRMITLRCPWNGEVALIKTGFRIGVTGAPVDNLSSGGICVPVDKEGGLGDAAFSYMTMRPYERYERHPATQIEFKGKRHPMFQEMKQAVIESAKKIPYMNILAWDVVATKAGHVKFLEVNSYSISVDWVQYGFGPLFGDYTEQVIDWCASHKKLADFRAVLF